MKFNVLIVDDEKNIREGLGKALELEDYNVFLAADGKEALAVINSEEIDLIISDLKMPEMSGEELLKKGRLRLSHGTGHHSDRSRYHRIRRQRHAGRGHMILSPNP